MNKVDEKAVFYISGKITGLNYIRTWYKFLDVEESYARKGEVINPLKICKTYWSWFRCMLVCIWNLRRATDIIMLPDWKESRGARIEYWIAKKILKLTIFYIKN
jgi:hypothetical protein